MADDAHMTLLKLSPTLTAFMSLMLRCFGSNSFLKKDIGAKPQFEDVGRVG